ncbi:Tn3 family transposase [Microbispora sp. NPDC046973]|uniref:Tn3 family transposase n=1 Tax=Microbispora sp. NPDC046973 TaxID=3155022 RepID=UPI0033EC7373
MGTEALLRRFTSETTHPAYAALLEVGRAQRSIFLARRLRDRDLQRERAQGRWPHLAEAVRQIRPTILLLQDPPGAAGQMCPRRRGMTAAPQSDQPALLPGRSPRPARPGRRRRSRATPARPCASLSQGSEDAH